MEQEKLDQICNQSASLIELKERQCQLEIEKTIILKDKCEKLRNIRILENRSKSMEMDEKERELCRQTNLLVDELMDTCDDSPFHKALIDILGNFKGILFYRFIAVSDRRQFTLEFYYHRFFPSAISFLTVGINTTRNNSKVCGNNISLLVDTVHSLQVNQDFHFKKLDQVLERVIRLIKVNICFICFILTFNLY